MLVQREALCFSDAYRASRCSQSVNLGLEGLNKRLLGESCDVVLVRNGGEVLSHGGCHFAAEVGLAQALYCHPECGGEEAGVGALHVSEEREWARRDLRVYDTKHLCNAGFRIYFFSITGVRGL